MMRSLRRFLLVAAVALGSVCPALAQEGVSASDWSLYKGKFLDPSGRIVDDANGGISHSEGQGYGLLLAYLADARADFDGIWSFTRTELLIRNDGLAAWKWEPNKSPHVTDANDATDGDILIAYALALAGARWHRPDLLEASADIARAVGSGAVVDGGGSAVLLPAVQGFSAAERPDGPVVNLSYWVFEAFPVLAGVAPEADWKAMGRSGTMLIRQTLAGTDRLPTDWTSLSGRPAPAAGFKAEFGYNALRIPLYLMRAGVRDPALLQPFLDRIRLADGAMQTVPAGGSTGERLADPGYRIIPALLACVLHGEKLPADLTRFAPTNYYPSTLQLLALSFAAQRHGECL